jgi:capsular polysaccharide biosynthesis protein
MEKKEIEFNLGDIFYLLLSKLHIIALIALLGGIVGFGAAKIILPVKYTSSVSIYVNNASEDAVVPEDGKATSADLYASQALAGTYIVILQDDIVYDEVSDLLIQDYELSDLKKLFTIKYEEGEPYIPASQIKSLVSISAVDDTEVISISATTENPQLSADICTYIAGIAPDLMKRTTHAGSVETIGSAKVPTEPSSPHVKRITLISFALGMVLAIAIIIVTDLIDNRIQFTDDFKKVFEDIPVLTEIPDMSENDKGGAKR